MEKTEIIFQLKDKVDPDDKLDPEKEKFINNLLNHDFPEPLVYRIGVVELVIEKLYDKKCESNCIPNPLPPLPASASPRERELFEVQTRLLNTFQATWSVLQKDRNKIAILSVTVFLNGLNSVRFAEENGRFVIESDIGSSTDLNGMPWGVCKINAPAAWPMSQEGADIVVGVVDSGVADSVITNVAINAEGKFGYDFSECDKYPRPENKNSHGTHCAGTIAADGSKFGIIGVAPKAKIMALKVLPKGEFAHYARAIVFAACNNVRIINNSWERVDNGDPLPFYLIDAINFAYLKDCILVFAAGNEDKDLSEYLPQDTQLRAEYEQVFHKRVILVGATTQDEGRYEYSNYGALVTIAAPGHNIISLVVTSRGYLPLNGTSMACAHVSGVIALMLKATKTFLSFERIKDIILNNFDEIVIDPNKPIGVGRINAYKCVKAASKI